MKIEKINDNQIRCTLTRDDLAQRQLKLSELAYSSFVRRSRCESGKTGIQFIRIFYFRNNQYNAICI